MPLRVRAVPFALLALSYAGAALGNLDTQHISSSHHKGAPHTTEGYANVCSELQGISSLEHAVFYPGADAYAELNGHYVGTSSQDSACVVVPHNTETVGEVLRVVARTKTPFAIKSGGHATNPGWSSTKGVHVSLNGFRDVVFNDLTRTAEIGTGLTWGEVYEALETHGVSVLGGRVADVGVGGFILGGGYSWHTNQYGLAVDTVVAFELVKPDGEVVEVTEKSDPDLFFSLKGGGNNFGIVTKFTMKTVEQGQVWGGLLGYAFPHTLGQISDLVAKFSAESTDPKASLLSSVTYFNGSSMIFVQPFYDGPTPPPGIFDDILAVQNVHSTVQTRSLTNLGKSIEGVDLLRGLRGYFLGLAVPAYSKEWLALLNDITAEYGAKLTPNSLAFLTFAVEPFLESSLTQFDSPSAFPWDRTTLYTPFNIFLAWVDPSQDAVFEKAMKDIRDRLEDALVEEGYEGVKSAPLYSNYAIWDTSLERVYGSSLGKLKEVKKRVDPEDVMGLAGGFKVKP